MVFFQKKGWGFILGFFAGFFVLGFFVFIYLDKRLNYADNNANDQLYVLNKKIDVNQSIITRRIDSVASLNNNNKKLAPVEKVKYTIISKKKKEATPKNVTVSKKNVSTPFLGQG